VYIARHLRDRKLQRALMQFFKPENCGRATYGILNPETIDKEKRQWQVFNIV
jgi:hypothetical protein